MKKLAYLLMVAALVFVFACNKDDKSERFKLLTGPTWASDSLLANGIDASGTGGILEKFNGDAKFREDGTGNFGIYEGKWTFNIEETRITIKPDSLVYAVICDIKELTKSSLKITTVVANQLDLNNPFNIRMTFKAK